MQIINQAYKINRVMPSVSIYGTQILFNVPAAKLIGMSEGDRYAFRIEDDGTIFIFKDGAKGIRHISNDFRKMNCAPLCRAIKAENKDKYKVLNPVIENGIKYFPLIKITQS